MLVSRMLRALLAGAQPHEILAITFTKKAAGEMRQRLQQWLAEFAQATPEQLLHELDIRGVPPQAAPGLVEPLRGLVPRAAAIGPPGAGAHLSQLVCGAAAQRAAGKCCSSWACPPATSCWKMTSDAVAAVWRRFSCRGGANQPEARTRLRSRRSHPRSLPDAQKALLSALAKRVEFGLADKAGMVETSVLHFGAQFPAFAAYAQPDDALADDAMRNTLWAAARALGQASAPTFSAKGAALELALTTHDAAGVLDALLTQKNEPRKFGEKVVGIALVREAQTLAQDLLAARDQHEAWQHHQRMARLTRRLIEAFSQLKRERSWVDMNDVESAARVMLSDDVLSGWVQERLDARVRHLLIDEFQDTNPLQWQALRHWLSGYAGAGSGTGSAAGGPPSVFIVGDPKQSIYRFRRAEPQVFLAAQQFVVEGLAGDLLSCDHTHRNAPALMAVVNAVMGAAQTEGAYSGFRPHTTESTADGGVACLPAIARALRPGGDAADPMAWRDTLTTPRDQPEDSLRAMEARQAAHWVAGLLADGRRPADLLVLARKRDRLSALQEELRHRHIPAQQPEKNDLADAPEVQDLIALVDALVSPAHDLSLARALKSPLFGVDDEDLVCLAQRQREAAASGGGGPQRQSWLDLLQKNDQLTAPLQGLGATLTRWAAWLGSLPPHDALAAIYHDGDVLARFAAAAPAAQRAGVLANVRALLGAALQVDGGRFLTPYALVRALRGRGAGGAGGARAPVVADANAVRLLTIHGAKGLEAPVVLMLDTDAASPRADTMGVLVDWPGESDVPQRFAFLASETRPPACCQLALAAEQQARGREELNALYVAMTRARGHLVLSSVEPHHAAPDSWWQRLLPHAAMLPTPPLDLTDATDQSAESAPLLLPTVPRPKADGVNSGPDAVDADAAAEKMPDSAASKVGQAMHRLLEWAQPRAACSAAQVAAVTREFGLVPSQAQAASAAALAILRGEGAWAWQEQHIDWQGNEVGLSHDGKMLRLDRLVRRRDTGAWWVLDYKSAAAPERQAEQRAQLQTYVKAVQTAYPGVPVCAAFLTATGKLVGME
jgi:ATP-dependent helicase/nuclease subunit A